MVKLPTVIGNVKRFPGYYLRKTGFIILLALLSTLTSFAQQPEVKGTILDEGTKLPVIGATIKLKGQQAGTATGTNGEFSLKVNKLPV